MNFLARILDWYEARQNDSRPRILTDSFDGKGVVKQVSVDELPEEWKQRLKEMPQQAIIELEE